MSRRPQRTKRPTRQSKARRLSLESLEARELLSGMTVTSTADNPSDPVSGTLRYAINYFNTHPDIGGNTIDFDIPGTGVQTINLSAALPTITSTSTLVIDGTDQPGYSSSPLIEINGSGAGAGANGLTVSAGSGGYIRGLSIVGFTSSNTGQGGAAIYLEGTAASEGSSWRPRITRSAARRRARPT
jgi:hypothetical protein